VFKFSDNSYATIPEFGDEKIIKMSVSPGYHSSQNVILFLAGTYQPYHIREAHIPIESGKVFGYGPGEILGIDLLQESFEENPIRCMPNMPPEDEEVVDIFAHHSRAYAVTIPKLSQQDH